MIKVNGSILEEIFRHKRSEVAERKRQLPLAVVRKAAGEAAPALDFVSGLRSRPAPALIAEVKRASPSRGVLRRDFDPVSLAQTCLLYTSPSPRD